MARWRRRGESDGALGGDGEGSSTATADQRPEAANAAARCRPRRLERPKVTAQAAWPAQASWPAQAGLAGAGPGLVVAIAGRGGSGTEVGDKTEWGAHEVGLCFSFF
jgi:hypothetical protein